MEMSGILLPGAGVPKKKSKAMVLAADGTGGLAQVVDHRFDAAEWPIQFKIETPHADTWLRYLRAECRKRNWGCSSLGQMEAKENSGSITVTTGPPGQAQLDIVWERKRDRPLYVRARKSGDPLFLVQDAQAFLDQITEACRAGHKGRVRVRGQLVYEGAPWRGELWLTNSLRLGPPSKQDETALWGQRVILVDSNVDAIDQLDAGAVLQVLMRDLAMFLTIVLRMHVAVDASHSRGWTWTTDTTGQIACELRELGYRETSFSAEIPNPNSASPVPTKTVGRPDFSEGGLYADVREQEVPADIVVLWNQFATLSPDRRDQFRRAGSLWQLAVSLSHDYQTTKFSLMVVACEALKPNVAEYDRHNIYDVIAALLSPSVADILRQNWFRPQEVRSAHLHAGEFWGSEFVERAMLSSYLDPTFDHATRTLWRVSAAALIEWLRRGGDLRMPPLRRRRTWRRLVKENALVFAFIAALVGIVAGSLLDHLLFR